jgi:hypothetical protein
MKFSRFEFKFAEERVVATKFVNSFGDYLVPDSYSHSGPYRVDSIYFDCHSLKDFNDKQNALLVRGKCRLRAYGNIFDSNNVFLEYKGKQGDFVTKERILLNEISLKRVLQGIPLSDALGDQLLEFSPKIIKEVVRRPTLRPLSIVSYDRAAFFFKHDQRIRMTLDTNIMSSSFKPYYKKLDLSNMRGGKSVIELKFLKALPVFVNDQIKHFGLSRVSNSKAEFSFSENSIRWC